MSFLAPPERDGTRLASVVVARTGEDALGGESRENRGAGKSWTVPPRAILMVGFGVANVGYVCDFRRSGIAIG